MDNPLVRRKENPLHVGHITDVDGRSRENIAAGNGNATRTLNQRHRIRHHLFGAERSKMVWIDSHRKGALERRASRGDEGSWATSMIQEDTMACCRWGLGGTRPVYCCQNQGGFHMKRVESITGGHRG